jgi:transcriptional regulator with XRE-family HTH domain
MIASEKRIIYSKGVAVPLSGRRHWGEMLIGRQIRAARTLLGWSAAELARRAGVSWTTLQRAEAAAGVPLARVHTINAIQRALEDGGIEIIDDGARSNGGGPGLRLRRRPTP